MEETKIGEGIERKMEREEQIKIKSALAEEIEPENGRNIVIVLVILFGVFALSFSGFKLYDHFTAATVIDVDGLHKQNLEGDLNQKEGYVYKGFSFVKVDGLWWTEIKYNNILYKIPLHFGPKEVENISVEGQLNALFNQVEEIYIAIDPEFANQYYTLALNELNFNVAKGIGRKPVGVCTKNNPICDNRTILNCNNTQGKPVIELRWGEEPKVKLEGSCILVTGKDYDLIRATNRLIWRWYGIMD